MSKNTGVNHHKHILSVILRQTQRLLRHDPSAINKLLAKAVAHYEAEEFAQAEACYRQILAEDPQHSDSLHLLGLIFASKGQEEEAIALMTQAIFYHPDIALYYSNRAALHQRLGRHMQAVTDFHKSIQLDPHHAGVWVNFGNSLLALEKIPGALDAYQKALELEPDYYTHQMIGNAYLAKESYEEAIISFQEALRLKPEFDEALINIGIALTALKKFDEAVNSYEQALAISPENATIHFNLGVMLVELGQYEAAEKRYHQAITINPRFVEPYISLWILCQSQGRHKEASDYLRQAWDIHPHHPEIIWNEAMISLQQGDFKAGWEKYEMRLQVLKEHKKQTKFSQPRWQGESFAGKTLLIRVEQGLGDTLQFIRYLPLVKQRGGRVIVVCQRELLHLFKACYPTVADVWVPQGGTPPLFDYYIDLISLPLIFQTTLDTIPFSEGYLRPPLNAALAEKIRGLSNNMKIGLVWAGNPKYKSDASRSLSLAQYKPILALKGFTFYSLQWGEKGTDDIAGEQLSDHLIDLSPEQNDFVDTATAVAEMDLVITVDTSIGHLAGAIGQKTWILLSTASDFRWLLGREDSPWYDSVRLFRQSKPGDWDGVIQRVVGELVGLHCCY